ncbi:MAG: alkaline phosphatase [Blastocatellia bacterium]|jgi:alkaline phosphatase|nr:alkaline phosphatase [Blastocatellia bacterium]
MIFTRVVMIAGILLVCWCSTAEARPTIRITPVDTARFVKDQRFDIRVEFTPAPGHSLTAVTLAIDGVAQPISISALDANLGNSIRGYSTSAVGPHTITASAVDSLDSTAAFGTCRFEIVDVAGEKRKYRNVIICLGDGMGTGHRTAARIVRHGYTAGKANGRLAMDEFPVYGMVMTSSLNAIVTDSSPGMSCYTTGNKSANGQQGVYPDNTSSAFDNPRVEYLGEFARRRLGKVVGIVTTADVEDATPGAMAAHTSNRGAGTGICDQFLDESELSNGRGNGIAVLLGGGRRWFLPASAPGSARSADTDYQLDSAVADQLGVPTGALDPERDLLANFRSRGFVHAGSATELEVAAANPDTRRLIGLFALANMNVAYDKIAGRRASARPAETSDTLPRDQPMLDEMTRAAITVLDRNRRGFMLLVEGASIDKQSHLMDADRAIWDTIEFDDAVRACREFADRDGNTLVIVVSDHECSGFSAIGALKRTTAEMRALPSDATNFAPASAANPSPARQTAVGLYTEAGFPNYVIAPDGYPETADPDYKLVIGFGANGDRFETWIDDSASRAEPSGSSVDECDTARHVGLSESRGDGATNGYFIRGQIPGTQAAHTATDVPVCAFGGKAAALFGGVQDNTDVYFKLMRALLGGY